LGRTDRRTERHEEGNGRFSEFFDCAKKKKCNSLTRLLVESLLCDDVSFQLFKVSPKFQGSTIENNPPLHHIRQPFNPIQTFSISLKDILKLPLFMINKTRFFFSIKVPKIYPAS
jgi:hypothetical protein